MHRLFCQACCLLLLSPLVALAQESSSVQTTLADGATEASSFSSVQDNLAIMDKDRDGMVTVYEVRAYIEARHGKDYAKEALDDMESSASGKSCGTPFAKPIAYR